MDKYKKILVDYFKLFTDKEWKELSAHSEIEKEVDHKAKEITLKFKFKTFFANASILKTLWDFAKDRKEEKHEGTIQLSVINNFETKEEVVSLINSYFNLSKISITLDPAQTDLLSQSLEIRNAPAVQQHKDNLQLFLKFVINKDFEIELIAPKKEAHQLYLFHIEERADLKGNKKYKLGLTDWEVFYWLSLKDDSFKGKPEVGKWYGCTYKLFAEGSLYLTYSDGNLESLTLLDIQEKPKEDLAEKKLIPLCIHTKYSAFDGLYKFKDFAQKAKEYGHKAIGVADLASVQSFAEVEAVSKELGLKPIYGTELELYDDNYDAFLNAELKESNTYCIFDIETTGLNPLYDEITEIAIHKYIGFEKVDEYHSYIKITKTLRQKIITLTRITDEQLEQYGRELPLVLREIKDFVEGSILVAHNGIEFDLPFLNAKYAQNNLEGLNMPFIDTMRLSQILFYEEKYKSHSLEAICKRNGGDYSPTEAHSASYDVNILWDVFSKLLVPELERQGFNIEDSWEDLNSRLFNPSIFKYAHGYNVLIYAKNNEGIRDLYEILSIAHTTSFHDRAMISKGTLNKFRKNLLIISPPLNSEIIGALFKNDEKALVNASEFYDYLILPPVSHFAHEIDREIIEEKEVAKALKRVFELLNKDKWLFNLAIRYLNIRESEQYLVLIHTKAISGKRHYLFDSREKNDVFPLFFYRNTEELLNEYAFLEQDIGELAFNNQESFLRQIENNLEVIKKKLHPPTIEGCVDLLKKQCQKKLKELYGKKLDKYIKDKFEFELNSIVDNNYSVIYWVSHLLVTESINNGFLVGSRGSVGSSFIAFLLNISEVNPLPPHYRCAACSYFEICKDFPESGFDLPSKLCEGCGKELSRDGHNIPFETFLGFGGNKVPDIDLNFSGEYQNKAHNFLRDYFGKDRVYRAGTISAMADKTAFAIVKTYLEETGKNYSQGRIYWLVKQIIDVKRTSGQHPGGILIVPNDYSVYDFSPINYPANDTSSDWLTTHLEFNDLHDALLKFDILGHDDPTTLARLKELTGFDPLNVPINDPNVLALYSSCKVLGVEEGDYVDNDTTGAIGLPEFGTLLTRKILKTCQPKSFADLIRISGFSHGTGVWKGNIDKFIKDGTHKLNEVITCRDDIMLYLLSMGLEREDAFNITESIRKGHGLSAKAEKILKNNNVPDWYIASAKKISYIFPKAHATAYVLMSWRIAYYKYYYPLHFYAVWFTLRAEDFDYSLIINNDIDEVKNRYRDIFERMKSTKYEIKSSVKNKEKTAFYVYEAALEFLKRGFKFRTISINESDYSDFKPLEKELLVPFIVIEGLGAIKAQALTKEREANGEYTSLEDLTKRAKLNKTVIQKLKDSKIIPEEWLYS